MVYPIFNQFGESNESLIVLNRQMVFMNNISKIKSENKNPFARIVTLKSNTSNNRSLEDRSHQKRVILRIGYFEIDHVKTGVF